VWLWDAALGSHWRCRRFARAAGLRPAREFVGIPSLRPPGYLVETSPAAMEHFWTRIAAVPGGAGIRWLAACALLALVRYLRPWWMVKAAAPARVLETRRP
jgi:hypothetical protein